MSEPVVLLQGLRKSYNLGRPNETEVLHGIDLQVEAGEFVALVGPSGSGKSTLLNMLGLLDEPTAGELYIRGQATRLLDDTGRTTLRGQALGFVFQFHHLIQAFTALENVLMPWMVTHGKPDATVREQARVLLAEVGLAEFTDKKPGDLSGGQQQRVAIARALMTRPAVLLADEPTGNLDTARSREIMEFLWHLNADLGITVIMVTHEHDMAAYARRIVRFVDGVVESDLPNPQPFALRAAAPAPTELANVA